MTETKPIIPLSAADAWDLSNAVEYDRKNLAPYRAHQTWLRACHEAYCASTLTTLSAEQAHLVYEQAWEEGHPSGYHEVEGWFETLEVLVAKILAL